MAAPRIAQVAGRPWPNDQTSNALLYHLQRLIAGERGDEVGRRVIDCSDAKDISKLSAHAARAVSVVGAGPCRTGGDRQCGDAEPPRLPIPRAARRRRVAQWRHGLGRSGSAVALVTQWGFPPVNFAAIFTALPAEDRAALRAVFGLPLALNVKELAGLPVLPLEGAGADAGRDEGKGETSCLTFTTSGTTSGPKLVLHDQQAIAGHAVDVARHIGMDAAGSVLLAAAPFCRTFGNAAAMAAIAGGAHLVCLAQFEGDAAAALIRQHRVTHLIGGDDMFGRIAAAAGGRGFESVRFSGFAAFHSTAAASIAAADAAGMRPHGLYGSSEVQALFSVSEGKTACSAAAYP